MYLVAIAWLYVALMMAVVEATSVQGSLLGAVFTFLLYGLAPVALLMYLFATPARRRARKLAEREADAAAASPTGPAVDPDRGGEAAAVAEAGPVAPERKEP
ncbi:hypothetical protein [Rivibacter subsaxonicus]|uniref:Transmembrane protein n=1 Tax=Rivibacter subsaxonicus TaxID=457575 RepID=A0A4Q7VAZ4_9BURK|nr:hypothetical protein [Rivibacter subsaxonicus]RZT93785.1 hypothetical protein EV670_3339 [Rivibacter subsaxonicus]